MTAPPLEIRESAVVDASAGQVWALVSDVVRMGEWSPECRKVVVVGGGTPREGTLLLGINRRGPVVWPTRSRIVRFEPERAIAWKTLESGATWTYEIEPAGDGTQVTARRELNGYSLVTRLFGPLVGGARGHDDDLAAGLRTTVARIKAEVEGS